MNTSPSELFISTDSLSASNNKKKNFPADTLKTIPLKRLSTSVPQVVTTTKTLRRCCGFSLALVGFIFYFARIVFTSIWTVYVKLITDTFDTIDLKILVLECTACFIGLGQFFMIMRYPHLTLKESNFKNVWMFSLIPLLSFLKIFLGSAWEFLSILLPVVETIFYIGYIYGLSLNGRSSSFWAGFKPFYYEMVPLILPIPPASRAYPQYTVPMNKV